jgi:hypothetical protein
MSVDENVGKMRAFYIAGRLVAYGTMRGPHWDTHLVSQDVPLNFTGRIQAEHIPCAQCDAMTGTPAQLPTELDTDDESIWRRMLETMITAYRKVIRREHKDDGE